MNRARSHLMRNRREFLWHGSGCLASAAALSRWGEPRVAALPAARPKVAAIFTEFTYRSHAHVILENFLEPYLFNGRWTSPGVDVVSFYADQLPPRDMACFVAKAYKIALYPTIAEALCLGGKQLAVDAVLSIGEFGNYPVNAKGQREYPRKRFFDDIVDVFQRNGRVVPVFNDKHLSYRWDWAKQMYDTAVRMKIPFMAGSSVPLAQRRPPLQLPPKVQVLEAVSIHGGPFEGYDFHGLEVLQSLAEFRAGGETGVSSVQMLNGAALWKAADDGLWSPKLADAAMAAELGSRQPTLRELIQRPPFNTPAPWGILIRYRDGLRAIVLKIGEKHTRWNFACRLAGNPEPQATSFYVGPWQNRNLFKALAHAIQTHFNERQAPYPLERTFLTTGILESAVESRYQSGKSLETPHLQIAYQPRDFRALREMGASWTIITEGMPEPAGIHPGGRRP